MTFVEIFGSFIEPKNCVPRDKDPVMCEFPIFFKGDFTDPRSTNSECMNCQYIPE